MILSRWNISITWFYLHKPQQTWFNGLQFLKLKIWDQSVNRNKLSRCLLGQWEKQKGLRMSVINDSNFFLNGWVEKLLRKFGQNGDFFPTGMNLG